MLSKQGWLYEEYSQWSRQLHSNYSEDELNKILVKLNENRITLSNSRLLAIKKSTSMVGNSQHRAQSRVSLTGNYEKYKAVSDAIEIYRMLK